MIAEAGERKSDGIVGIDGGLCLCRASQGFGAVTRRIDYLGASELTISSKRGFVADPKRQQGVRNHQ